MHVNISDREIFVLMQMYMINPGIQLNHFYE